MALHHSVIFVRGINVSASTRLAMADLKELLKSAGYLRPQTLLASGNAIVSSPAALTVDDRTRIEQLLSEHMGRPISVLIRSEAHIVASLADPALDRLVHNGDLSSLDENPARLTFSFVDDLDRALWDDFELPSAQELYPEALVLGEECVYGWFGNGISQSKVAAAVWKQFGPRQTMRNLATVRKVAVALEKQRALSPGE